MSSAQAFQHFGVALPSSATNLQYVAQSGDAGSQGTATYVLGAKFAIDCQDVREFVARSSLRSVTDGLQLPNADLDSFATRHGWSASASVHDSWYQRDFTEFQTIEVLVEHATDKCTVYLTA